jgi:hypothetical protein
MIYSGDREVHKIVEQIVMNGVVGANFRRAEEGIGGYRSCYF